MLVQEIQLSMTMRIILGCAKRPRGARPMACGAAMPSDSGFSSTAARPRRDGRAAAAGHPRGQTPRAIGVGRAPARRA